MDIKKLSIYSNQQVQRPQEVENRPTEQGRAASVRQSAQSTGPDRVELSSGYQQIDRIKKVVMELGDVRTERVDILRNMIENNDYALQFDKIAEKMLGEAQ